MQVNASLPRHKDEDTHTYTAVNMKLFAWERTDSKKTLLLIVGQVKREWTQPPASQLGKFKLHVLCMRDVLGFNGALVPVSSCKR